MSEQSLPDQLEEIRRNATEMRTDLKWTKWLAGAAFAASVANGIGSVPVPASAFIFLSLGAFPPAPGLLNFIAYLF